jgi:large subunit ribosomal protein L14e
MAFEIGRVCVKLAGRDAGCTCVIIDTLENGYVLIDGETRRRKCNVMHLEPLARTIEIGKNSTHEAVCKALGVEAGTGKPKKAGQKPTTKRVHGGPQAKKPVAKPAAKPAAAAAKPASAAPATAAPAKKAAKVTK